jgi:hypothetical protein
MSFPRKPPNGSGPHFRLSGKRPCPSPEFGPTDAAVHQISTDSVFMLKTRSNELLRLICDPATGADPA